MQAITPRATLSALLAVAVLLALLAASPAQAESECISDPTGDVFDRSTEAASDKPEADIVSACVVHDETTVEISVRVVQPTDPRTHPAWQDFRSTVGAALDTDGDGTEEYDVNYALFAGDQLQAKVFVHETSEEVCTATGLFDGTRYRMLIPRTCLGDPAEVSAAAYAVFESNAEDQEVVGFTDGAPGYPALTGPFTTAPDPETGIQRLAGGSRVDTAIAISQADFADGEAAAVVLARAGEFPDALAAAPLAVALDAPLLLTETHTLVAQVRPEIQRVLPAGGTVYVTGGVAAINDDVVAEVEELGYDVERIDGRTRYETSVAIAAQANPDPTVIVVANGNDFPDALVGGALAGAEQGVQILSNGPEMSAEGATYLTEHPDGEVVAVGAVAAEAAPDATPIVGEDAFATSVAVAEQRFEDVDGLAIASGTNWPDGLAGGAHAGRLGIPLLLSWPDLLPESVSTYLAGVTPVADAYMYGGVAALSHQAERDAQSVLG